MHTSPRRATAFSLIVTAGLLAGCGGGGSSSGGGGGVTPPTPTPTPAPTTCTSVSSVGRRPAANSQSGVAPNRLYVTYRAGTRTRGTQSLERIAGAERGIDLGTEGGVLRRAITLAVGTDAARATAALRAMPEVVDVQPLHVRSALSVTSPSDPLFNNDDQWYLFVTHATPEGWSHAPDGTGVTIAVVDTGIDETNADLIPKVDVRESVINGVVTTGAGSVQDTDGHGTNVAGLAGATTNNGFGFASVGYNAHLQIYKVFPNATAGNPCPTADTGDEARAVRDAVANNAAVINLSLGSPQSGGFDQAEKDAVEFAIGQGVVVVAAGGNDTASVPDFPGGYPGVISVGGSAVQDAQADAFSSITGEIVAPYSNSGVTLVAPGGSVSSTADPDTLHWVEGYSTTTAAKAADRCTPVGGVCRALFEGTSQATPQVAGTVALMEAFHGGPKTLTPAAVTALLQANSDSIGAAAARQGAGRLNVGRAVAAAHP